MDQFWLTDKQFAMITPHILNDTRGKEHVDDRRVISGIVHVLSLRDPVLDGLARGFELASEVSRIAAGTDQLDHLAAELNEVCRTGLGHQERALSNITATS